MSQRSRYIRPGIRRLSVRRQCDLLSVNRSCLYYRPVEEKPENVKMMTLIAYSGESLPAFRDESGSSSLLVKVH